MPHRDPGALAAPRGFTHRLGRRLMVAVITARETVAAWPVGRGEPISTPGGRDPSLSRLLARFAVSGLLAMVVIGAAAFVIVRRSATSDAITQAKDLAQLAGRGIAAPVITPQVLKGDPAALARQRVRGDRGHRSHAGGAVGSPAQARALAARPVARY